MITNAIEKALAKKIECMQLQGPDETIQGDVNQFFRHETDKGTFFVKTQHTEDINAVAAEAHALQLIDETDTIRVPHPEYFGTCKEETFLIVEYIPLFPHTKKSMALLGEQLAHLHLASKEKRFGFELNNTLGTTQQLNHWSKEWIPFFQKQRLEWQLQIVEEHFQDTELIELGEQVIEKLPSFFEGVSITPSLLHGNLCEDNTATDAEGNPLIFDPASYYGHHEADLCLIDKEKEFSHAFFDAYHAIIPKAKGFEERQNLYSLYHALNNYNTFGIGYRSGSLELIAALLKT